MALTAGGKERPRLSLAALPPKKNSQEGAVPTLGLSSFCCLRGESVGGGVASCCPLYQGELCPEKDTLRPNPQPVNVTLFRTRVLADEGKKRACAGLGWP